MSRPDGVSLGEAYKPSPEAIAIDSIAALKETMPDITPLEIFKEQAKLEEIQ